MTGVYLSSVLVTGPGRAPAEIEFADGLNVVAGASDTGKSYLASVIDFALGASRSPREIEAATGYSMVTVRLVERDSGTQHEIRRGFARPARADFRRIDGDEATAWQSLPARHSAGVDADTLSARLLSVSGFRNDLRIRRNARGETRALSFRDIAYLCVVDEARIIAERPPYLSESPVEHTTRTEVLKLLVTGQANGEQAFAVSVPDSGDTRAQLALLDALITEQQSELHPSWPPAPLIESRINEITEARQAVIAEYEASTRNAAAIQNRITVAATELRETEGRIVVGEGLQRRFSLLADHYRSDLERLATMREAADMLVLMPVGVCPVCGASPEDHRPDAVADHYSVEDLRAAARAEQAKAESLLTDLEPVMLEAERDLSSDIERRGELRSLVTELERELDEDLRPLISVSVEHIAALDRSRDQLLTAREKLASLSYIQARADSIRQQVAQPRPAAPSSRISGILGPLEASIEALLGEWKFPHGIDVAFSDSTRDIVIGGEQRSSHGKGVRALTCAAFLLGLMRHARESILPHFGVVVLDSPLVAYQEPDPSLSDSGALIEAGVKDAFYESLAGGASGGQCIVLENEEPPDHLKSQIRYHHFSKSETGRYGLFPQQP